MLCSEAAGGTTPHNPNWPVVQPVVCTAKTVTPRDTRADTH